MNSDISLKASNKIKLLSDTPAKDDILDYSAYQDAIVSIVRGLSPNSAFTIAVFGDWGSGKTTLLRMIRNELKSLNIKSVWVNVWQFGNEEDVWKAFLQAILLNVKEEMSWSKRLLFNLGLLRRRIDWQEINNKLPELVIRLIIVIVPLYLSLSNLIPSTTSAQSTSTGQVVAVAGTISASLLGWFLLLQPYLQAVKDRVKIDLQGLTKSSPLKKRVTLLEEFKNFFEIMTESLIGKNGQLVIFIDDLDRCPPDRIVGVLDAIKLFLDTHSCIYMIGLDREITEQAITHKYSQYKNPTAEAREYLEKIISLPFDLPPLSGQQMEALVSSLEANLPDAAHSSRVFAFGQEPNPRKVKRTINTFLLLWTLSKLRAEIKDVIKPTRLAKLVVIQHSYRDLYLILMLFPHHLAELEIYFRQSDEFSDSDSKIQSEEDEKQDETQPLVKFPDYLQPFLRNENLKRLLTLHPVQGKGNEYVNFTIWENGQYKPISEEEIRAYIRLTRSITPNQGKVGTFDRPIFINRQMELQTFRELLNRKSAAKKIVTLVARGGMGKTALLQQFARICREESIPFASIDLRNSNVPLSIMTKIAEQLSGREFDEFYQKTRSIENVPEITQEFMFALKDKTSQSKSVIFFDSYETSDRNLKNWFSNSLLKTIANDGLPNIIVIIAGQEVPDIPQNAENDLILDLSLSGFSREHIEEFFKASGVQISDDDLEAIGSYLGGNPKLTAELVQTMGNFEGRKT